MKQENETGSLGVSTTSMMVEFLLKKTMNCLSRCTVVGQAFRRKCLFTTPELSEKGIGCVNDNTIRYTQPSVLDATREF